MGHGGHGHWICLVQRADIARKNILPQTEQGFQELPHGDVSNYKLGGGVPAPARVVLRKSGQPWLQRRRGPFARAGG